MSFRKSTEGRIVIALWFLFFVAIAIGLIFFSPPQRSGRGREALERLRKGTVEIIADGVEKGVRRASGEE